MFQAINATTRAGSGYSGIENVNVAGGGGFDNVQESFLFAEVLKYAYLAQIDGESRRISDRVFVTDSSLDEEFQVQANGKNSFVFNTEAHPLKVAG
jgi:mannosyl-oligosaccharide alpha-1,2-mannosidase